MENNTSEKLLESLFGLTGKVAVMSGAATGFGRAACVLLANLGARVIAVDQDAEKLQKLSALAGGTNVQSILANVCDEQSVVNTFAKIQEKFGGLDILINASTAMGSLPFTELTVAEWQRQHDENSLSAFLCCREAVRLMLASGTGGRIVNVTTIGAQHPILFGNAAYSASKAAVQMLTKNIALDYARSGITANCLMPGAMLSEETASIKTRPSGPGAGPDRHLMGAFTPADVAPMLLPFIGPAGRYVTGQALAIDGGFLLS